MTYLYHSPVGAFTIKPSENGHFAVYINKIFLGCYPTPEAAALDISLHATGWKEWDIFPGHEEPRDLCKWRFVPDS